MNLTTRDRVRPPTRTLAFSAPVAAKTRCVHLAQASLARAMDCGHVADHEGAQAFARCVYLRHVLDLVDDAISAPWTVEEARALSFVTWQWDAVPGPHDDGAAPVD